MRQYVNGKFKKAPVEITGKDLKQLVLDKQKEVNDVREYYKKKPVWREKLPGNADQEAQGG